MHVKLQQVVRGQREEMDPYYFSQNVCSTIKMADSTKVSSSVNSHRQNSLNTFIQTAV